MQNRPTFINCYYYSPHHHSLLDSHLEWDLAKIAELGCHAVSVCVHPADMVAWFQQRLANVVALGHKHSLQVHAVPNGWCGLLAGWIPGGGGPDWRTDTSPNHDAVRQYYRQQLRLMLDKYPFDGVIWDEPRPPEDHANVAAFLDEMSAFIKQELRPEAIISLFGASDWLDFAPHLVRIRHIDYLGSDGHVRSDNHQMHRMKPTIFQAHAAFYPVLKAADKKTMFLLEGQRHRDEDLDNYLENLDKAFSLPMDQLMFYYSAHEMPPEKALIQTEATWAAVKRIAQIS